MDAMTTERPTIGHNAGRMTEAEYERQRAKIAKTKAEAGIRWEQELARLFALSGWTQEQLAKKEGRSRVWATYLLKFGQFLANSENVTVVTNLTERRFRSYWQRTSGGNDRIRFRDVARLMEGEVTLRKNPPLTKNIGRQIVAKCRPSKWYAAADMADKADVTADEVHRVLATMVKYPTHGAKAERKKVGKDFHYRIFKQDKTVSVDELIEKLTPIIKGLQVEGKKHVAQRVEAEIAKLAEQLKRLLDAWAERTA